MFQEHLILHNVKRALAFPYRLSEISYSVGVNYGSQVTFKGIDLEFCIRIASRENFAEDIFDGKSYHSSFPFLAIKPPDVVHINNIGGVREALSLYYPRSLIPGFIKTGFPLEMPGWAIKITPAVSDLIKDIRNLVPLSQFYGVVDQLDLKAFQLLEMLFLQRNNNHETISDDEKKIRSIASYLHLKFTEKINFEEIARKNGYSLRSFYRKWNQYYKDPPKNYLMKIRFSEVGRLLRSTNMTVADIISELGVNDRTQFYKSFKDYFGMTPSEYREVVKIPK
jgi:transcriptional regulator, araC family